MRGASWVSLTEVSRFETFTEVEFALVQATGGNTRGEVDFSPPFHLLGTTQVPRPERPRENH